MFFFDVFDFLNLFVNKQGKKEKEMTKRREK